MKTQTAKALTAFATLLVAALFAQAQYAYITLDHPLGVGTHAQGISGTNIVGYYDDTNGAAHGFIYNGSKWTTLDHPLGVNGTYAQGISGSNIVGYYYDSSHTAHGFIYNGSAWTTFDHPQAQTNFQSAFGQSAYGTFANAIDGTNIVGNYYSTNGGVGQFLYTASTWTSLDLGGAYATGISGDEIVGWSPGWGPMVGGGFYNGSTWIVLNDPNGSVGTAPVGIDGTNIVGYYRDANDATHGFLYNSSTWTTLDHPLGFEGTFAQGISGVTIVGTYFDSGHAYLAHGFLAKPIPQLAITLLGESVKLSWPAWADNFVLQQTLDLGPTDWVPVPERPILNAYNMQYEVLLNRAFVLQDSNFRLKQQ